MGEREQALLNHAHLQAPHSSSVDDICHTTVNLGHEITATNEYYTLTSHRYYHNLSCALKCTYETFTHMDMDSPTSYMIAVQWVHKLCSPLSKREDIMSVAVCGDKIAFMT